MGFRLAEIGLIPVALAILTSNSSARLPLQKHRLPHTNDQVFGQELMPMTVPANGTVSVDLTPSHVLNKFNPSLALGVGIDAIGAGGAPSLFSDANVNTMLGAGLGSLSYRLYTELNVEDWHWNPAGSWSDAHHSQGYFVGNPTLGATIQHSYGYLLTHRGSTYDFGSNLKYSNIDDGDLTSYWKSNPYLTSAFTHESDVLHPQWILFILPAIRNVNAVQIHWANPYAVTYKVQYWTGDDPLFDPTHGAWVTFPRGTFAGAKGGAVIEKLSTSPIPVQFVRILMTTSSDTYDTHGTLDARNRMGYAVYEAGVGSIDLQGNFTDYVQHSPTQNQTTIYVSSTDPWHGAASENTATEQVGIDYLLASRLAQGNPAMVPAPMLYSTPENAAAEAEYITSRHYPILGIELGEEPDGQYMSPEDYGALFVQWAAAIHKVNPKLSVGGPVTSYNGVQTWPDPFGHTDFLKRFVGYLKSHNALTSLGFISTEHYPYYQATMNWSLVGEEVGQVQSIMAWVADAQVGRTLPVYVTEYNLSAAPDERICDIVGALWHAAFVGEFLISGGTGAYFYQYLPYEVSSGGTSYGLIGMLESNDADQAIAKTSQYFSSQLMALEWCQPGNGIHSMLPTATTLKTSEGNEVVLPYAVARPDGQFALMLVNTDSVPHNTTVSFSDTRTHTFTGPVSQIQFSSKDYTWISNGLNSIANPDGPYEKSTVTGGSGVSYTLRPHSLTVLRGRIL